MNKNEFIGKLGENIAIRYLLKNNYLLINKNYRIGFDEIDVVAKNNSGTLTFFEVKSSFGKDFSPYIFSPEDRFSSAKRHRIIRACEKFLLLNPDIMDDERGWEIDLLAIRIYFDRRRFDIAHYKNV